MSGLPLDRDPPGTESDREWCYEAVQGVSRTFALTIDVLDEPMSSYICVGYLLCRVADTVEDAGQIPPEEQVRLLDVYDRALDPDDRTTIEAFVDAVEPWVPPPADRSEDWHVVADAARVVRTFDALPADAREAIRPPVRELVGGMSRFVDRYAEEGGLRIQTAAELEEYCYYAAGTVGQLITNLVCRGDVATETRERLYDTAEEFGLLLQLVNIAKDVHADKHEEDNVYLPASWLDDEGVSQEGVCEPHHRDGAAAVVRRTADHAKSFLGDAQTYLELVPTTDGNRLAAWAIPFLLATGTLRELSTRPEDALSGRGVKVSREEVLAVVTAMTADAGRETLGALRETILRQPFHRTSSPEM